MDTELMITYTVIDDNINKYSTNKTTMQSQCTEIILVIQATIFCV